MAKTRKSEQVRERILEEATHLFAECGYAGASTAQIVRAAGITKPMLYYYFGDKESLFRAAIERINSRRKSAVATILESAEPAPVRLICLFKAIFKLARENPMDTRLPYSAFYGPKIGDDSEHIQESGQILFLGIMNIVHSGLAKNELSGDPEHIIMSLMGVLTLHLMAHDARPEDTTLTDELAETAILSLLKGIGPA